MSTSSSRAQAVAAHAGRWRTRRGGIAPPQAAQKPVMYDQDRAGANVDPRADVESPVSKDADERRRCYASLTSCDVERLASIGVDLFGRRCKEVGYGAHGSPIHRRPLCSSSCPQETAIHAQGIVA